MHLQARLVGDSYCAARTVTIQGKKGAALCVPLPPPTVNDREMREKKLRVFSLERGVTKII